MNALRRIVPFALLSGIAACESPAAVAPASVQFRVDAPLCGGTRIRLQFSIDHNVVGTDTLTDRQTSKAYATVAGQHVIGAVIPGAVFTHDTTVTMESAKTFTDVLSVYCS